MGSQFLPLLEGMLNGELRENSANLTLTVCKKYNNKKFILNEKTSISFCATEVANALGISAKGYTMKIKKSSFPPYMDDLKKKYSTNLGKKEKTSKEDKTKITGKTKRDLSAASLKSILQNMPDDEVNRIYYKKLLLFFIVDQFLLPTSEKAYMRSSMSDLVDDLEEFEKINWAKSVLELI
jgi:hypothetical protein